MTLSTEERTRRLSRTCKTCGKCMNSLDCRQVVCSAECGHKGRSKGKAIYECVICGKQVERYVRHQEQYPVVACSKQCQVVIAGKAGKNIIAASNRAKKAWYRKHSKERAEKNEWWKLCCSQAGKSQQNNADVTQADQWKRRCQNAVSAMNMRANPLNTMKDREPCDNWECLIIAEVSRIKAVKSRAMIDPWMRKAQNAMSSLKKRARRRSVKQHQRD